MSTTIDQVTTAKTFDEWRQITNELVTHAGNSFTLDANNSPSGTVTLTGDFSFGNVNNTLKVPKLEPLDGQTTVSVDGLLSVSNNISISRTGATAGVLQFVKDTADTWSMATNNAHTTLSFSDGTTTLSIAAAGITTSAGVRIANDMLPENVTIDGTFTAISGEASFNNVDIDGGAIDGTIIGATTAAGGSFTTVDIDGGTIDGTSIGTSTASSGTFTTIATTSNGNITLNGTGQLRGDVAKADGTTIVDVSAAQFNGQATGLTEAGITQVLNAVYPVGSLYTTTSTDNPYNIIGVGSSVQSWERFAEGRTLKGYDPGIGIASSSNVNWVTTTDNLDGTTTGILQGPGSGGNAITITRAATEMTLSGDHEFKIGEYVSVNNITTHGSTSTQLVIDGADVLAVEGDWGEENGSFGRYLVVETPASNKITVYPQIPNAQAASGEYATVSTYGAYRDTSTNAVGGEDRAYINIDNLPSHDHAYDNTDATDAQQGLYNRVTTMSGFLTTGKATDYTAGEMNVFVGAVMQKTGNNLHTPIDPKFALCSIWKRVS